MKIELRMTVDSVPHSLSEIVTIIAHNLLCSDIEEIKVRVKALTMVSENDQGDLSLKLLCGIWESAPNGRISNTGVTWEHPMYSESQDSYECVITIS